MEEEDIALLDFVILNQKQRSTTVAAVITEVELFKGINNFRKQFQMLVLGACRGFLLSLKYKPLLNCVAAYVTLTV